MVMITIRKALVVSLMVLPVEPFTERSKYEGHIASISHMFEV